MTEEEEKALRVRVPTSGSQIGMEWRAGGGGRGFREEYEPLEFSRVLGFSKSEEPVRSGCTFYQDRPC